MKFSTILLAAATGFAAARELTRCGTAEPNDALKVELNEAYFSRVAEVSKAENRSVNVYVHVVTSQAKRSQYTKEMVQEQVLLTIKHPTRSEQLFTHKRSRWKS